MRILLILTLLILVGCNEKESISIESCQEIISNKNYFISWEHDNTYNQNIYFVLEAEYNDVSMKIETTELFSSVYIFNVQECTPVFFRVKAIDFDTSIESEYSNTIIKIIYK